MAWGGGVAIYAAQEYCAQKWGDGERSREMEVLWVRTEHVVTSYVSVIYHLPIAARVSRERH
jgi:hypothetical protein